MASLGSFPTFFEGQFDFVTCMNGKLLDIELHGIIDRLSAVIALAEVMNNKLCCPCDGPKALEPAEYLCHVGLAVFVTIYPK
jgi:hypothetical protein